MSDDKNDLNKKFNLPVPTTEGPDKKVPMKPDDETSSDFKYVRENLYRLAEQGQEAVEELVQIARSSQHPRAYEVLATLLSRNVEINKAFLELRKQRKDLEGPEQGPTTINNHLTLTTQALNELIANAQKNTEAAAPVIDVTPRPLEKKED